MYYLVQENLWKEGNFINLINTLERAKLDYEIIKWRPFDEEVNIHTDRKDIVCFGGVSLTKAAIKYEWKPGIFFNEGHDMEVYHEKYGDYMLNSDGVSINYGDPLPDFLDDIFFARPTRDSKIFTGGLFSRKEWEDWKNTPLALGIKSNIQHDTRIFAANEKSYINREIRCWVVDGKVITISCYKMGKRGHQQNYDHESSAIDFAQKMVDIYAPSRAFVLDICLHQGDYRVVEINCLNSAGFYDANMSKLIQAIEAMEY